MRTPPARISGKASGVSSSGTIEPTTLRGKLHITGLLYTEPAGEGKCRRIYESSVVAKIFGVGGMIESRIIADVKASYDKAAEFTNRWVKEKRL